MQCGHGDTGAALSAVDFCDKLNVVSRLEPRSSPSR
jgi:hypothetical protein